MILPSEYIYKLINDSKKKAFNKSRECLVRGCKNKCINSHTLWKKGILDILTDSSKNVIALNVARPIWSEKLEFKLYSVNQTLTFKGFCNKHDHSIFKPIESDKVDYNAYKNQLLISVRGFFHERRKKEINIDCYQELLNHSTLPLEDHIAAYYVNEINMNRLGINDISFYTKELNKEYNNPSGKFYFKTYYLPFIPIAASSHFTIDSYKTMTYNASVNPNWENEALNHFIFNLFPVQNKSYLIVGFHTNFLENINIINRINKYDTIQLFNLISNILIDRIESWICNPIFFNKYLKEDSEYITTEFDKILENDNDFTGEITNSYNMFKRYLKVILE